MAWTDDELQQLDAIRYRRGAARAFRAVVSGLAIVVAIRSGIGYGIGAWLLGLVVAQMLEPEIPERLEARARELDRQRAGGAR